MALREHVFELADEKATRRLGAALAATLRTHLPALPPKVSSWACRATWVPERRH